MNLKLKITLIRILFLRKVISKALSSQRKLLKVYNEMNRKKLK